jgi:hypothetical protein
MSELRDAGSIPATTAARCEESSESSRRDRLPASGPEGETMNDRRSTRGCNGPRRHCVPIAADEPQGR